MNDWMETLKFDEHGLIPAIVQDAVTRDVLMMAYMNREALTRTVESNLACFYSRSRQMLWQKGESSGNVLRVADIRYDCDADTLLVLALPAGPACHTGHQSCFYRNSSGEELEKVKISPDEAYGETGPAILLELMELIRSRYAERPEGSYTTYLFEKGIDKILKKVGEESAEVIIAAKNPDQSELIYEASDLIYHLMVLLVEKKVSLDQIFSELKRRR
ncbi:MAG: bifunctional phosphoribosyl-AMP cyclohydrolase/phosphoribosyl-ATP diphosphatase HisIE [Solirubrobacterales bacterium]